MSDYNGQEAHAVVQAGVGVFFQQDVGGFVVVKTIVKGGSAERDGTVQIGDRILSVDDRSVAGEFFLSFVLSSSDRKDPL